MEAVQTVLGVLIIVGIAAFLIWGIGKAGANTRKAREKKAMQMLAARKSPTPSPTEPTPYVEDWRKEAQADVDRAKSRYHGCMAAVVTVAVFFALLMLLALLSSQWGIAVIFALAAVGVLLFGSGPITERSETALAEEEDYERRVAEAQLERTLAALSFDLANAFNSSDLAAATDIWSAPQNSPFSPDDLIEVMRDAQATGQLWNGEKVNAVLQSRWEKFLRETYAYSRDDFMMTLHDKSKEKGR